MVKRATSSVALALATLALAATATPSQAQLTEGQIDALVQSTYADVDVILLTALSGGTIGGTTRYLYASAIDDFPLWEGIMTGSTSGVPFTLYHGGFEQLMIWFTTGTLGGQSVTGGGTFSIAYPTPTIFSLALTDTLSVTGSTASAAFTIPGSDLGSDFAMLGSTADPEDIIGSVTLNGSPTAQQFSLSFKDLDDGVLFDDVSYDGRPWSQSFGVYGPQVMETISVSVPETSTWTMMLAGFAGLGFAMSRRAASTRRALPVRHPVGGPERGQDLRLAAADDGQLGEALNSPNEATRQPKFCWYSTAA